LPYHVMAFSASVAIVSIVAAGATLVWTTPGRPDMTWSTRVVLPVHGEQVHVGGSNAVESRQSEGESPGATMALAYCSIRTNALHRGAGAKG